MKEFLCERSSGYFDFNVCYQDESCFCWVAFLMGKPTPKGVSIPDKWYRDMIKVFLAEDPFRKVA